MKRKKRHSRLRLKIAIVIVLALVWLIAGVFRYINSPRVQSMIYASINQISSLKIQSAVLNLSLVKRKIAVSDINLFNPEKNQRITADKASFNFKILPLFKASLKVSNLNVNNLKIDIAPAEKPKKRRARISLGSLLLFRNLAIKNGVIDKITVTTPKSSVTSKRAEINFIPSIWGDIKLSLRIESLQFTPKDKPPVAAEEINIKGSTDVSDWVDLFPYVDNLSGKIDLKQLKWKALDIETFSAKLNYFGKKINIYSSKASIQGHAIEIDGEVGGDTQKYSLNINIPEPIYLPSLGGDTSFIDTSGRLGGKITISGHGLDYKNTKATADISLNHELGGKESLPAGLASQINIAGGQMSISKATLKIGNTPVEVRGSFNYMKPDLNLSFEGENIPAETVLNRFLNRHYHPIKGVARVRGHFGGWKPNLKFDLKVDASPASYYDIAIGNLKMDLSMTYHELALNGTIYQGEREAASAKLKVQFGKKLADGTRHKTFQLTALLINYDLTPSMAEYDLAGTGNGMITLQGTPNSYSGSGKAAISDGTFKGIGFQSAKSDIKFSTRKIIFDHMAMASSETNPATFASPLVMDVTDNGIRLHGTPREGITVDARYLSGQGMWRIDKLTYASIEEPAWESKLSGTVGGEGNLNLRVTGMFDTSLLSYLRGFVREAKGPAGLNNIHIGGTTENTSITGSLTLNDNSLQLRGWAYYIDKIKGAITFKGRTITTSNLTGRIEYGDFALKGLVNHQNNSISHADLGLDAKSILYATPDKAFRMEFDCDLTFKGGPSSSTLGGSINIVDGRYTKNFSIFEKMKKGMAYEVKAPVETAWKNMKLNLKIKNAGDLRIDNNIGEIWLNADLAITGLRQKPRIAGNIETIGGEIHYAGLDFEVTRGYVEFRDPYINPFMEFIAAKEVGNYNITLTVRGRINKLYFDLQSTPPLDRKDILALLTFGVTEEEMKEVRFGYQIGAGLAAEQIGSILQRPVTKFTPLDRFRIEAAPGTGRGDVTRLHMGKDISDRLRINFITDINTENAQQTFQAEYLITDFLLLKGARMSNSRYRFHLTFRFREQ